MKLFYHIGYPRTATTFLQKHIFPKHKDINYLGCKYHNNEKQIISYYKLYKLGQLYTSHEILSGNIDYDKVEQIININIFKDNNINLLSSESLASYTNLNNFVDIKLINKYLESKNKNIELHFLLVVRNQFDLIKSTFYHSYPLMPKHMGVKTFNELVSLFGFGTDIPTYKTYEFHKNIKYFKFNSLYDFLKENFPSAKIKVLMYEDLLNKKEFFLQELSEFLKIDQKTTLEMSSNEDSVNKLKKKDGVIYYGSSMKFLISNNKFYIKIRPLIPKFIRKFLTFLLTKKEESYNDKINDREKVLKFFEEDNEKFFKKLNKNNPYKA